MKNNKTIEYKVAAHHITNYSEDRKIGTNCQGEYFDLERVSNRRLVKLHTEKTQNALFIKYYWCNKGE
jgi:hypothetical protein